MQRNVLFVALSLALMSLLSAVTILPVAAQDTLTADNSPYPIIVAVGQAVKICSTGTAICPVKFTICNDASIATIRESPGGPEIVGIMRGTTFCNVISANSVRFVYKVIVH